MIFDIEASCGSFIGNGCGDNEDNFYFNKKHLPEKNKGLKNPIKFKGNTADSVFFAVFDGMGGGSYGAEAACTASVIFAEEYKKLDELALSGKEFMVTAVQRANEKINEILC